VHQVTAVKLRYIVLPQIYAIVISLSVNISTIVMTRLKTWKVKPKLNVGSTTPLPAEDN